MDDLFPAIWLLGRGRRMLASLAHPVPALTELVAQEQWVGRGEDAYCHVSPAEGAAVVIDCTAVEESPQEAAFRRLVEEGNASPVEWAAVVAPTARLTVNVYRAIVRRRERGAFLRWASSVVGKDALKALHGDRQK